MRLEPVAVYKSPDGRFFVRKDFDGSYHLIEWPSERVLSWMPYWQLRTAIAACDKAYRDHLGGP